MTIAAASSASAFRFELAAFMSFHFDVDSYADARDIPKPDQPTNVPDPFPSLAFGPSADSGAKQGGGVSKAGARQASPAAFNARTQRATAPTAPCTCGRRPSGHAFFGAEVDRFAKEGASAPGPWANQNQGEAALPKSVIQSGDLARVFSSSGISAWASLSGLLRGH